MSLFLIIGSRDLGARVTAACGAYYLPFAGCAFVSYEGTVEQLAQRLMLLGSAAPSPRRALALRRGGRRFITQIFPS